MFQHCGSPRGLSQEPNASPQPKEHVPKSKEKRNSFGITTEKWLANSMRNIEYTHPSMILKGTIIESVGYS